jgi:hypothetical protein
MAKNFDMTEVYYTVNGQRITGYADGGGISTTIPGDVATEIVGTDGLVTKVDDNDKRVHLETNVQRSSRAFDVLHALYQLQQADGTFRFPVSLVDLNPDSEYAITSPAAYFVNYPELDIGDGPGDGNFIVSCPEGLDTATVSP